MDPNAALAEALDLSRAVLDDESDTYPDNLGADGTRLAEVFLGLHEFITKGGFLPAAWSVGR